MSPLRYRDADLQDLNLSRVIKRTPVWALLHGSLHSLVFQKSESLPSAKELGMADAVLLPAFLLARSAGCVSQLIA